MNDPSRRVTRPPIELPPGDPGYYYDPRVVAGQHGEIRLSPRVEERCKCGGRPPYQIFKGTDAEPSWCPCRPYRMRVARVNHLIADSWIPERFRFRFLDTFAEAGPDGRSVSGAARLKAHVSTLIDRFKLDPAMRADRKQNGIPEAVPPKGLFLWGVPGNGKTHLACIALNELMFASARPGKFVGISRKFFQTLRHTFDADSPTRGQAANIIDTLGKVPFLVIDDLGVQRDTEWEVETLYNLVDARYAERKLTLVTTNKDINDIKNLAGGRIYSRFLEMCTIIHMTAGDYREHYKKELEL